MVFAKLVGALGAIVFGAAAVGIAGTGAMAAGAILLLVAAVAGAVALEERDSVDGLVVQDLTAEVPVVDERIDAFAA